MCVRVCACVCALPTSFPMLATVLLSKELTIHLHFSGCQCARACVSACTERMRTQKRFETEPQILSSLDGLNFLSSLHVWLLTYHTGRTPNHQKPSSALNPSPTGMFNQSFMHSIGAFETVSVLNLKISPLASSFFSLKRVIGRLRWRN